MQTFTAEVEFRFRATSLEAAGKELVRLSEAAREAGFELRRGQVEPAGSNEDERGPTWYAPL